ncbi:MAG: hypothetical protein AAB383_06235 [Patescibacteria group bacterium]
MDRSLVSEQESAEMAQSFTANMEVTPDSSGLEKLREEISKCLHQPYDGRKNGVLWAIENGFSLKPCVASKLKPNALTVLAVPTKKDELDRFTWGEASIREGFHNAIKEPTGRWDPTGIKTRGHTEFTFFDWNRENSIQRFIGFPYGTFILSLDKTTIKVLQGVWREKLVDIGKKGATVYSGRLGVNGRRNFTEWVDYGRWENTLVDEEVTVGTLKQQLALWTAQR